ncbi:hypothetical protein HanRHA438_Chr11g0522501 [Helianthus annuus]|nr:hypothetical protein HanRHA438_Chr11g0522501 [Helianthus annuus]
MNDRAGKPHSTTYERCWTCAKVKVEHRKPTCLSSNQKHPYGNENKHHEFVICLLRTQNGTDIT